MRSYRVYQLVDPRHQLGDTEYIRYIGYTTLKLKDELQHILSGWPNEGGPRRALLTELTDVGVSPAIIAVDKFYSAGEAKDRVDKLVQYCEEQGYKLINSQLDDRCAVWDRERVTEDFQIEVMRLLLGQESPYERALRKLEEEGQRGSALYTYLRAANTPDILLDEIPALFHARDERVMSLSNKVIRAIDAGEIQGSIASVLREAIEGI